MNIKEYKEASGKTLAEIGEICGVSRQAVHQWVRGVCQPSTRALAALREYLAK